jgi:integrase
VRLPGAHRVVKRSDTGTRIFWYAWRGGPQIAAFTGASDADAFDSEAAGAPALAAAWADTAYPKPSATTFEGLAAAFKASPAFLKLAPSTQALWRPAIDRTVATFGPTSLKAMEAKGIRARIKLWHAGMADTPRAANIHLQVLGRILEWGVDEERLTRNAARGIAHLDEGPGRAGILITAGDMAALCEHATPAFARLLNILLHTGLRRADLVELIWAEIDYTAGHLVRPTNKSGGKRHACPPLTADLKAALGKRGAPQDAVCRRDDGTAWPDGRRLYKAFEALRARTVKALRKAALESAGTAHRAALESQAEELGAKHLHDFRGTYITFGYASGASDIDMEIRMGWAPGEGAAMRAIYASPAQLARAAAARAITPARRRKAA